MAWEESTLPRCDPVCIPADHLCGRLLCVRHGIHPPARAFPQVRFGLGSALTKFVPLRGVIQ